MDSRSILVSATLVLVAAVACSTPETAEEIEARQQAARADSVAMAEALYDASVFDTLTWESPQARLDRGGVVWRTSCQKCHGSEGQGGGELAAQAGIEVPSFLAADWHYAGEVDSIRRRIFVGHEGAMPNWGLHGLKYRDLDAAAAYIDARTRPPEEK